MAVKLPEYLWRIYGVAHTLKIRGYRQLSRNALTSRYVSRECAKNRTLSAVNLPAQPTVVQIRPGPL